MKKSTKSPATNNVNMLNNIMKSTAEQKQKMSGTVKMKMGGSKKGCGCK